MKNPFSKFITILILCLTIAFGASLAISCSSSNDSQDDAEQKEETATDKTEEETAEEEHVLYVLSYASGGASGTLPVAQEGYKGDYLTVQACGLTNDGLEFLGWSDGKSLYQPGDIYVMKAGSAVLTATWESVETTFATYTLAEDNTLVLASYITTDTSVVIPSTHNGKYVSGIAKGAFGNNSTITSLTLPASLQSMESGALNGLVKLANLSIPFVGGELTGASGDATFFGYIFGTDSYTGSYEVSGCQLPKSLSNVTITGGTLSEGAFAGCYGLKTVTLPADTEELPASLFEGAGITKITLPASVKSIGANALKAFTEGNEYTLTAINVESGNSVYSSQNGVLYSKDGTELILYPIAKTGEFVLPAGVQKIADGAFAQATCELSFAGSAVTKLTKDALNGYKGKKILLGTTLEKIEEGAFKVASELKSIDATGSAYFTLDGNVLYSSDMTELICAPAKCALTEYTVSASTVFVYDGAFYNVASLETLKLVDGVAYVGSDAFNGTQVAILNLPYSVYSAGERLVSAGKIVNIESLKAPQGFEDGEQVVNYGVGGYTDGDWNYVIRDNSAIPTDYNGTLEGALNIPDTLGGHSVVTVGSILWGLEGVTTVTLPATLTSINPFAFAGLNGIGAVTIPAGVGVIEYGAFSGTKLAGISFADGSKLVEIKAEAFKDAVFTSNKKVTLPSNLKKLGKYAFAGSNIAEIDFYNTKLESVSEGVFNNATALRKASIGAGVVGIGKYAFAGCESLSDVDFTRSSGLSTIGERAFEGCVAIAAIELPRQTMSLATGAFAGCSGLVSITLQENNVLSYLGAYAFEDCSSIKTFTVTTTMLNLGKGCFEGCYRMVIYCEALSEPTDDFTNWEEGWNGSCPIIWNSRENYVARDNSIYFHEGENLYKLKNSQITLIRYGGSVITDEISYGTTKYPLVAIEEDAYAYSDVEELTIPASVKKIANGALRGANKLKALTVYYLGSISSDSAFGSLFGSELSDGMTLVTQKITINGVKDTYEFAYPLTLAKLTLKGGRVDTGELSGLTMLNEIVIDGDVTIKAGGIADLGNAIIRISSDEIPSAWSALWNVDNYPVIMNTAGGNKYDADGYTYEAIDGSLYRTKGEICELFAYTSATNIVTIADFVTAIAGGAFSAEGASSFIVAEGNTSFVVENGILYNADITEVVAFPALSDTATYIFPITVTAVHDYAFYGAENLQSVTIGENVITIGAYAFYGSGITQIIIPAAVESIDAYAFAECKDAISLTVHYGSALKTIGEGAFKNCTSLQSVTELRSDLEEIGAWAFAGCGSLTDIFIPQGVTKIGGYAFYSCGSLAIRVAVESNADLDWDATWNCDRRNVEWGAD